MNNYSSDQIEGITKTLEIIISDPKSLTENEFDNLAKSLYMLENHQIPNMWKEEVGEEKPHDCGLSLDEWRQAVREDDPKRIIQWINDELSDLEDATNENAFDKENHVTQGEKTILNNMTINPIETDEDRELYKIESGKVGFSVNGVPGVYKLEYVEAPTDKTHVWKDILTRLRGFFKYKVNETLLKTFDTERFLYLINLFEKSIISSREHDTDIMSEDEIKELATMWYEEEFNIINNQIDNPIKYDSDTDTNDTDSIIQSFCDILKDYIQKGISPQYGCQGYLHHIADTLRMAKDILLPEYMEKKAVQIATEKNPEHHISNETSGIPAQINGVDITILKNDIGIQISEGFTIIPTYIYNELLKLKNAV